VTEAWVSALNAPRHAKAGWVWVPARVVIMGQAPASVDCSSEAIPSTWVVGASEVGGAGSMSFGGGPDFLRSPALARLAWNAVPSGAFGGLQTAVGTAVAWQGAPWLPAGLSSAHPYGTP